MSYDLTYITHLSLERAIHNTVPPARGFLEAGEAEGAAIQRGHGQVGVLDPRPDCLEQPPVDRLEEMVGDPVEETYGDCPPASPVAALEVCAAPRAAHRRPLVHAEVL